MSQLQRIRDAIEQGARDNDASTAQWDRWVEYADALRAEEREMVTMALDACVSGYANGGDHHGAAVANHIQAAVNSAMYDVGAP